MYERSFPAIGERFFKKTAWPTPDAIATHAENDPVFKMLYAELYYRHLHQATTPSANERKGSWENYCELFGDAVARRRQHAVAERVVVRDGG